LSSALADVQRLRAKEAWILNACLVVYAYLYWLEKIRKKVRLKEWKLIQQGLCELENEKRGFSLKDLETVLYSLVVGSLSTLRSPLTDLFFNPSFSLLPNLISFNML